MKISELLNEQRIVLHLNADSKKELIREVVQTLDDDLNPQQLTEVTAAVLEREEVMSTGVGKGLAIPHAKVEGLEQNYAAFALLDEPIDYEALDGEPVSMVFLIIGPRSQNSLHIKMLSRISRLMNNVEFRDTLRSSSTVKEIIEAFSKEESLYFNI